MAHVATRWHTFEEAVLDGRVRLANLSADATRLQVPNAQMLDLREFVTQVEAMGELPRFVVEPDVMRLLETDQSALSIGDMVVCGVLNLPFKECVFEYSVGETTYMVQLTETEAADGTFSWDALAVAYNGQSKTALIFPAALRLRVEGSDEAEISTESDTLSYPEIHAGVYPAPYMRDSSQLDAQIEDAQPLMVTRCFTAFVAAVLLPQTLGLRREQTEIRDSFNKARIAKGKSAIPDHTIIRLGAIDRTTEFGRGEADRGGIEVHLRRAHKKRVALGPGRAQRAWRFIPAQVVGYLPDGRKPTMPEMLATRASRPYLLHSATVGVSSARASLH